MVDNQAGQDIGRKSAQVVFLTTPAVRDRIERLCALLGASRGGVLNPALLGGGLTELERRAEHEFGEDWMAQGDRALKWARATAKRGRPIGVPGATKRKSAAGRRAGKPAAKVVFADGADRDV